MRSEPAACDVAILGTGIGGSLLGAILAANGLDVLLFEQGVHPRFAIGESTIPETTVLLRLMARRYGVPEIAHLSNFHRVRSRVSPACGIKRNFSFHYHRPGEPADPRETNQFLTWAPPFGPDIHFFRQDTDAWALAVAAAYGARVRQQTAVQEIRFADDGVELATAAGEAFRARYVVDAGGIQAPLARLFGLREEPCPLATRSRTIFTHLLGVPPYDRCAPPRREHGLPSPLGQGTLHHLFDGGWMWVIPFDNHPFATNGLCSVGLTLDLARHPEPEGTPEEELQRVVARFPSVAQHLGDARPMRPWIGTGRLQYLATRSVGDRFALLPHAASFVDPLFSSGLAVTMSAINSLAWRLIAARSDGDFSGQRFAYVDTWTARAFAYYDQLVSGAYVAFRDFALWNAWHRLWMLGSLYGAAGLFEVLSRQDRGGGEAACRQLETAPYRGLQAIDFEPLQELLAAAGSEIDAVRGGETAAGEAAGRIFELLAASGLCPPSWKLTDPGHRWAGSLTLLPTVRLVAWGRYRSPAAVRRSYFQTGRSRGLLWDLGRLAADELGRGAGALSTVVRDALWSGNADWRRTAFAPAAEGARAKRRETPLAAAATQPEAATQPNAAA